MNSPFSIPADGNQFFVYLKQYSFIWITLFLLVETDFLAKENHFFSSIFRFSRHCLVATAFELSTALRLVETDFLANGNHILFIFQIIVPVIALSGLV